MTQEQYTYTEDKIDIRELWQVLIKRKNTIIIITGIFTILAIAYSLLATPWYEAKAFVEIGTYKNGAKETLLDDGNKLTKRLQVEFIDIFENIKDRDVKVTSVNSLKKNIAFIEIKALGKSNQLAMDEVTKVVNNIKDSHKDILHTVIESRQAHLNDIDRQISSVENNELKNLNENLEYEKKVHLPQLKEKLALVKSNLDKDHKQLQIISRNIKNTQSKNPSLAALNVIERSRLDSRISQKELDIINIETAIKALEDKTIKQLERKINITITNKLAKLKETRSLTAQALKPHNFKNSDVVGEIITSEYPAKPKKKIIVIVSFITGLMLSIFLVFFLEFIQTSKREQEVEE